ncbi:hypothetical protein SKAU_G00370500 [Synaphobranchus kaupii]|uniref:BHLH domain-containing protein n=1 Tax=Synaphobranchus kaupii TaxID=118154 RepID=A0A9Q1IFV1_SYNKA|nr:hypothetical protein SKAU_G00370500 [Synaphobranchus kaupii]
MKLVKGTQTKDVKKRRKSQVERHRRERMNRSLESLRAMLVKGQHQPGLASRQVEKAEILEHTVLFLQGTENMVTRDGAEQQHFQDGFLACLRRAAQFLKVAGEGQQAGRALTDTLSFRLSRPSTRDATTRLSACPPQAQSEELPVQARQHGRKCRQQLCAAIRNHRTTPLPHQRALAQADPNNPQCRHRNAAVALYSSSFTHSQAMWRPWS